MLTTISEQVTNTHSKQTWLTKFKTTLTSSLLLLTTSQTIYADESLGHFSQTYTPQQILADISQWENFLHSTHPNLAHSVENIDEFYTQLDSLRSSIKTPMTGQALWRELAKLNATMADGHLSFDDGKNAQWRAWVKDGVQLFPLEVVVNNQGLFVKSTLGGDANAYQGKQISHINGIPASTVTEELLLRIEGDNLAFRHALLSRRFAMTYRLVYGTKENFNLKFKDEETTVTLNALNQQPESIQSKPFEHYFNLQMLDNKQAILTVKTFGWDEPKKYFDFMAEAFQQLNTNQVEHLLIDISENTGGDDEYWMAGILRYIAQKPYKQGSDYSAKILAKYRDPGEVVGTVVTGSLSRMIKPETDKSKLFKGQVSVLTGPLTYSSAVLFANTIQDHQFATLIGAPTGGRSTQSGGIQFLKLSNTQIRAVVPRFILARPSGNQQMTPVQPDIELTINPFNKAQTLADALSHSSKL